MIRAFIKTPEGTIAPFERDLRSSGELPQWLWVDVTAPQDDEIFWLARRFELDPIAVEDILEPTQFPKVDDFEDHLLCVMHGLRIAPGTTDVTTQEIDVIVTPTTLLTFHPEDVPGIEWLIEQASESDSMVVGGPDRMFARLAEITARRFLPIIDEFDQRIVVLEDLAIEAHPSVVATSQALRHDAIRLRRVLAPQREVAVSLAREGHDMIGDRARQRFGDVQDHLYRLVETLDSARALLASVLDTYRSTVSENMNDVMKVLTVFSAILLPLSLMAGIYGMNFANMPELDWRWAYFGLLAVMTTTGTGLWLYFSRRGFIGGPRLSRVSLGVGRGLGYGIKGLEYGARGIGVGLKGIALIGTAPIRVVAAGLRTIIDEEDDGQPPESK